jgi:hypothetical protein
MNVILFVKEELKKGLEWLAALALFLARWIFRVLLRLAFFGLFLFLAGGGCLLRFYLVEKSKPGQNFIVKKQMPVENYTVDLASSVYPRKTESLENRIRTGQSQVRSWDYTLRSIKSDIERWVKK